MSWSTGRESSRIPERIKRLVRERDGHQCTLRYPGCVGTADEFDHITGLASTRTSRYDKAALHPDALRSVCVPCHRIRTQEQAQAGRNRGKRKPPKHPSDVIAND